MYLRFTMDIQAIILETPRLLLRAITPELFNYVMETYTDEQLMDYFGYDTEDRLVKEKERHAGGITTFRTAMLYFHLIDKESNRVIGGCGYHTWYVPHARAEIGYELFSEPHKNKGLMKEALLPILAYGFDKMNLHRIEAFVSPENTPSIQLMKHAGFSKEGHLREHYFKDGRYEDSVVFSILKSEWKHSHNS